MKIKPRSLTNILLAGTLTMTASLMQSCSEETYPDVSAPDKGGENEAVKHYFSMKIFTAENEDIEVGDNEFQFGDGSDFEHSMDVTDNSQNVVIFFNDDWSYYGYAGIDYDRLYAQGTQGGIPSEISYIGVIHSPDPEDIYNLPNYGLLVLNAFNITDALDAFEGKPGISIDDILKLTDNASSGRRPGMSGAYHTMTSTAYLSPEGGGWEHSILFKLDKTKIYDNRMQAVLTPAATAYVERMSAKFSLTLPGSEGGNTQKFVPDGGRAQVIVCNYVDGQPNYNNRTWTCSVDAWGINKYETQEYYFRNIIGEGARAASYPYTYGPDINTTGQPFYNGWNRHFAKRAFWAVDPHYKEGIYPRQYRPAVDNPELEYYGANGPASLGYVSYNELSTDFSRINSSEGANVYSSENTFPDTRIGGLWQHDLGASEVIIGAKIHINRVDETKADYDLYRNRIGVFYPSATDFASYFIQTFNNQLASQSNMTYRFYNWSDPTKNAGTEMRQVAITKSNYRLYFGNEPLTPERMAAMAKMTIPATIENGDGKVIPWVEGMYIGRREIDPDTYEEIGDIQRLSLQTDDFKSLIYDWIGSFDHFNKGRMVYAVPVLHNASVEKVSAGDYRPTVGDYGVARNTWYSFAVDAINKLGDPVDDPDQKIIIYQTSLENSIMVEMKVADWHIFSTDVTLPDKLK